MKIPVTGNMSMPKEQGLPDGRVSTQVSPEVFGSSIAQAGQRGAAQMGAAMQTLTNTGKEALQINEKLEDQKAQADAFNASNTFQSVLNSRLTNPQDGYLNRKGANAIDAGKQFGADMDKAMGDIRKDLTPQAQRYFDRLTIPKVLTHLEQLSLHEANERRNYEWNSFKANIENNANGLGGATDPKVEQTYRNLIIDQIKNFKPGEVSDEQRQAMQRDALTKGYLTLIGNLVDQDKISDASALLSRVKGDIDSDTALKLQKSIEENGLTKKMRDYYQGLKLTGKTWQQAEGEIIAGKSPFKGKEQERMIEFGRREFNYETHQQNTILTKNLLDDRNFIWNKTMDKAAVEKYINNIPADQGDRLKHAQTEYRERFNLDATGHSKTSNDFTYLALMKQVDSGAGDPKAILQAYDQGAINSTDKTQLLHHLYNYNTNQDKTRMSKVWDQVEVQIKSKYDGDSIKQQDALAYLKRGAFEKNIQDPDQLINYVEQEMKKDGIFGDPMWEIHSKAEYQDSQKYGELVQWLGKDNLYSIVSSMLDPNNPGKKESWKPEDVWGFMRAIGLDKQVDVTLPDGSTIKSNTRAWNAIGSLQKRGALVTVENVQKVLAKYPDGRMP